MIIGFVGLIGSGKDTCADTLVSEGGFRRVSFATTLKDAVAAVFGWDREALEGNSEESRKWREEVDEWWSEKLGIPELTPRWVLQYWGTDVLRKNFHDDIWIASLENRLLQMKQDAVISDVRFPNEIKMIKRLRGKVYRIKRGDDPEWWNVALRQNEANKMAKKSKNMVLADKMETDYPEVHLSEYAWIGEKIDGVIENDGSIDDLRDAVRNQVLGLPASK